MAVEGMAALGGFEVLHSSAGHHPDTSLCSHTAEPSFGAYCGVVLCPRCFRLNPRERRRPQAE